MHQFTVSYIGTCVFRCNLPCALLAELPGSFMCCYLGGTDTEISQDRQFTMENKICLSVLSGLQPTTFHFNHKSRALPVPLSYPHSSYEENSVANLCPFCYCCCCCRLLLYSAILHSQAESLCSHVILYDLRVTRFL